MREQPTFRFAWETIAVSSLPPVTTGGLPCYLSIYQNVPVLFFAGLYSERSDDQFTYAILTLDTEVEIAQRHNRLPVIQHSDKLSKRLNREVEDARPELSD